MELTRAVDTVYREVIEKGSRSRIQEREGRGELGLRLSGWLKTEERR